MRLSHRSYGQWYFKGSVRKIRISLGVAALLWGFLQAPFDHIHLGEDLEHQATAAPVHLHLHGALDVDGPALAPRTADDDEIDVLWSVAKSAHGLHAAGPALVEHVEVLPPAAIAETVVVPRPRAHDPPEAGPRIPRAPPA